MVKNKADSFDQRKIKGEKTKNNILQAAVRLFSEKGFDGTSVKDITDAAGIPKSLFYHYFKSMDELLGNIINTNNLRISPEDLNAYKAANNTEMMNTFISRIYTAMHNDKENLKILFLESLKSKKFFDSFLDRLAQFSSDFDLITPDELKKGYDPKELVILRLYYRFLPIIMLILTEEQVAGHYNMTPEQIRNLLFHVLQGSVIPDKQQD